MIKTKFKVGETIVYKGLAGTHFKENTQAHPAWNEDKYVDIGEYMVIEHITQSGSYRFENIGSLKPQKNNKPPLFRSAKSSLFSRNFVEKTCEPMYTGKGTLFDFL